MMTTNLEYNGGLLLVTILASAILFYTGKFIFNKFKTTTYFKKSNLFNPHEYFPDEEIHTLKQVFYLVMIILFVTLTLYLMDLSTHGLSFRILDIIVSFYLAYELEKDTSWRRLKLFLLIPFGSISVMIAGINLIVVLDILHALIIIYFIKEYYKKFMEYTESNSLGITIMLLFLIVFLSYLFTIVVEGVSPLDALEMVSNAFTSNGYTVLGNSDLGKFEAIFLVWSGFILSGVGTATLTASLVMRHVNDEFDRLEELIKKNKKN